MDNLKIKLPVTDNGVELSTEPIVPVIPKVETPEPPKAPESTDPPKPADPPKTDEPTIEKVVIDDVEYTLNAQGDAVKADGTVHLTKVELDALEEVSADTQDEEDAISIIQDTLEFKPEANGKPVVYERTKAGLAKLVTDAITAQGIEVANAELARYFEENPDVAQKRDYKTLNGSLEGYQPETIWGKVKVEELTDDQIAQVIKHERLVKGDSEVVANYYVDGLKKDGKLKDFITDSITYLDNKQKQQAVLAEQTRQQAEQKEATRISNYWKSVDKALEAKTLVVNNELFNLPTSFRVNEGNGKTVVKTIKDFNDYIKKPLLFTINNETVRLTQNQYDDYLEQQGSTPDTDTFKALRRFLHYDDSQLVLAKAKQDEVTKIRKLQSRTGAKSDKPSGGSLKLKLPV